MESINYESEGEKDQDMMDCKYNSLMLPYETNTSKKFSRWIKMIKKQRELGGATD